jgi:hypothetical protein
MSERRSKGSGWRDDRVWQAGFLVGSAIGAAATVLGRRAERVARQGLVEPPPIAMDIHQVDELVHGSPGPAKARGPVTSFG